ncbi:NAD(P)-binding domain-containing protein [Streptomyces nogalater]
MSRTPAVGAVGIVGAGAVGQAVATTLCMAGFCRRLLIASRTAEQAAALAADIDDMRQTTASPVHPAPAEWSTWPTARQWSSSCAPPSPTPGTPTSAWAARSPTRPRSASWLPRCTATPGQCWW